MKLCVNCKWMQDGQVFGKKCIRPDYISVVTGNSVSVWNDCDFERGEGEYANIHGDCGIDGKFWEAKEGLDE